MNSAPSALRSTVVVSATRGVSAFLSLVQGVLSAHYFGTSYQKDSFLVAQTIPSMVTTFLIGGVYSTLLVNLADVGREEGAAGQRAFTRRILGRLSLVLLPLVAVVLLAPAWLVGLVAPGFSEEKVALTASLLRLTVFGAVGMLFMAGVRCLFEVRGQFLAPSLVNLANPLASLVILVALVGGIGIYTLAVGPLVGFALSLLLLVALIPRYITDPAGFVGRPANPADTTRRVRSFWLAFLPMSIGANFGQINMVVDNAFASTLPTGSITMLGFAFVIVANAQLLTTSTFAEVSFSRLAANAASSAADLKVLFRSQMRHMLLLTAPLSVGALAFATPLVRLLFERGAFTPEATVGVAAALRAYAPGMFFMGYLTLFSVLLMSRRRFALISTMAAGIIAINALLDYLLIKRFGLTGIALGTTLTILVHALFLLRPVMRLLDGIGGPGDAGYLVKVLTSAATMGAVVFGFASAFERFFNPATQGVRIAEVLLGLAIAAGTYLVTLRLLKVAEVAILMQRLAGPVSRYLHRPHGGGRS